MCDPVTIGLLVSGAATAASVLKKPSVPKLPETADPAVAQKKAVETAAVADVERQRRVQAGGRPSTILAGRLVAEEQQRKTLLGQ